MKTQPETNTETNVKSVDETINISGEQFKQALTAESNKRITDFTNKVNQTIQGEDEAENNTLLKIENHYLKEGNQDLKKQIIVLKEKNENAKVYLIGVFVGSITAFSLIKLFNTLFAKRNS